MEPEDVDHAPGKLKLEEKAHILALKEEGLSSAKIAKRLGRHRASIDRLLVKTKSLPKYQIPNRKKGSGRPKKVNNMLKRMLKRQIIKYPAMTPAEIQVSVPELRVVSGADHPVDSSEGPQDALPCCCYEAPAHRKNYGKEAQVCKEVPALYQGKLGQGDVFGRIHLQMPRVNQDHHQEAPGEQQIRQPLHSQNCETSRQRNGLGELLWNPGTCWPLFHAKEYDNEWYPLLGGPRRPPANVHEDPWLHPFLTRWCALPSLQTHQRFSG